MDYRKINYFRLKIAFCIALFTAMYAIFTLGRALIHSDTATTILLAEAQIKYMSLLPKDWCYVNGDIWILSQNLFALPFMYVVDDMTTVRNMVAFFANVVVGLGVFFFCKKFTLDNSWLLSIPLLLVYIFGEISMILFESAYILQVLWHVLAISLFYYGFIIEKYKLCKLSYSALIFILCCSGIRSIAEIVLPMMVTFFFWKRARISNCSLSMDEKDVYESRENKDLLLCIIPTIMGFIVFYLLNKVLIVNNTGRNSIVFADTLNQCGYNFINVNTNLFLCFGYHGGVPLFSSSGIQNILSFCTCLLVVYIIPYLAYRNYKRLNENTKFLFVYMIVHALEFLLICTVFSKLEVRYMITVVFLAVIFSSHYLFSYFLQIEKKSIVVLLISLCTIFQSCYLISCCRGWQSKYNNQVQIVKEIESCGVFKGYATYWNAYKYMVYSNLKLRFGGVNLKKEYIATYPWLVDNNVFIDSKQKSFLLLDERENNKYRQDIVRMLGESETYKKINNLHLYIYNYDIVTKMKHESRADCDKL